MSDTPDNVRSMVLYAWVGEDEHGSGEVGLKQGVTPSGIIPLVSVSREKLAAREHQLQAQADMFGKTIRLCKFVFVEEIITVEKKS